MSDVAATLSPMYFRVSPSIWRHRSWTDDMRLLALYLVTSPHRTLEGLFVIPKGYICADLQWLPERLAEPFARLTDEGFIMYDDTEEVCLVVKAMKYQPPANPNMDLSAVRRIMSVPSVASIDARFYASAERYAERFAERLRQQLPERFGKPQLSSTQHSTTQRARAREAVVDNSDSSAPGREELGEEQAPEGQEQERSLNGYRWSAQCESTCDGCDVRECEHIEIPEQWHDAESIEALQGMAGYICRRCQDASCGPGVTMEMRQPICAAALTEYVETLKAFDATKHIHDLPAYLRTRLKRMTEAPVSDALLGKLRALERHSAGPAKGKREPTRIGELLPDIPIEAQPRKSAIPCEPHTLGTLHSASHPTPAKCPGAAGSARGVARTLGGGHHSERVYSTPGRKSQGVRRDDQAR